MSYKIRALTPSESQLFDRIMSLCEKKYGHFKVDDKLDILGIHAPYKTVAGFIKEILKNKNLIKNPAIKSKKLVCDMLGMTNKNVSYVLMSLEKAARENELLRADKDFNLIVGFLLVLSTHLAVNAIAVHVQEMQKNERYIRMMFEGGQRWMWSYENEYMASISEVTLQSFKKMASAHYLQMLGAFREDFKLPNISFNMMRTLIESRTTEANHFEFAFNGEVVLADNSKLIRISSMHDSVLENLMPELVNMFHAKGLIARRQFMVYLNHEQGNILQLDAFYDKKSHKLIIVCCNIHDMAMQHQFLTRLSQRLLEQEIDFSIYAAFFKDFDEKPEQISLLSYYMMKASSKLAFDQTLDTLVKPVTPIGDLNELPNVTWVICESLSKALDAIYIKQSDYVYHQMLNISLLSSEFAKGCAHYFSAEHVAFNANNIEKIKERYSANSLSQAVRRGAAGKNSIAEFRALLKVAKLEDVDKRDDTLDSKKSALHHAVIKEKLKRAVLLTEKGANPVSKDFHKKSAKNYFEELPLESALKKNAGLCYYFEHQKRMFAPIKNNLPLARIEERVKVDSPLKLKGAEEKSDDSLDIQFSKMKL